MSTVLGIDTGGTYTDGVIIDLKTKEILAATKAPTTHHQLIEGIRNTIRQLEYDALDTLEYVALSTTLATNAIVEGRGCRVGLILMGFTPMDTLPSCEYRVVKGKINVRGDEEEALDLNEINDAIAFLKGKVDAIAISGIFSIHNPIQEETVKTMVRDALHLPVITAHELTTVLGMQERTTTAVLNARLISVIDELMSATKEALLEKEIHAPIMIVKGDGSLMNETVARERPIETILSGPAASIIGSVFLNDAKNGLVLDMGGTTTDIAILKDGRPRLDKEGASVGGWHTRVNAVEASTYGLGGDSRIYMDYNLKKTMVGPMRCWPVSAICRDYPSYLVELKYILSAKTGMIVNELPEGYFLLRDVPKHMELTEKQRNVIEVLKDGPHTIVNIAKKIDTTPNFLNVDSLVEHGILGMIGFTPTDILHIEGSYTIGSTEGAEIALELMVEARNTKKEDFLLEMKTLISDKLCRVILDSTMNYEKFSLNPKNNDETLESYFNNAIWQKKNDILSLKYHLHMPIIGIGAPVGSWLPEAAEKFHTKACFPQHNDVANAIGAAAGKVMTVYHIKVQSLDMGRICIFAPWGQIPFHIEEEELLLEMAEALTAEERMDKAGNFASTKGKLIEVGKKDEKVERAVDLALTEGKARMVEEMERQGIHQYDILIERRDVDSGNTYNDNNKIHIETFLEIVAVGRPQWQEA